MTMVDIDCLGIDRVLKRGTGEIIEDRAEALLVRDTVSGAYFLACENATLGLSLLDRHAGRGINLLMVSNDAIGKTAFERYGFSDKLICYQVAYYGKSKRYFSLVYCIHVVYDVIADHHERQGEAAHLEVGCSHLYGRGILDEYSYKRLSEKEE